MSLEAATLWSYLTVLLGTGIVALILLIRDRSLLKKLFPIPWLRRGQWSGAEVLLAYLTLNLAAALVAALFLQGGLLNTIYDGEPGVKVALWTTPFSLVLSLALILTLFYFATSTFPSDLGLSPRRWRANYILAFLAFVLVTPVVLGIQGLLLQVIDSKDHPFTKLANADTTPLEWTLFFFMAVINAPVLEELFFRGILQNWLRRATLPGHMVFVAAVASTGISGAIHDENYLLGIFTGLLIVAYTYQVDRLRRQDAFRTLDDFWPEDSPTSTEDNEDEVMTDSTPDERPLTLPEKDALARWKTHDMMQQKRKVNLAIFGSSMFFSLVHFPAWPAPIALMILGLVLGWLAQRTQNLVPCILLHAFFNSVAFLTLFYSINL